MRKAVVTGAASGIGQAVATQLSRDGWYVVGLDRAFEDHFQQASDIAQSAVAGMAATVSCDVSDSEAIDTAFARIGAECGYVDALVCAAGVLATGALVTMPVADFDRLFAVNTRGAWLSARAAVPLMRTSPNKASGPRVVFLGSIAGIRPKIGGGAYGAQKAALHVLTGVLAAELGPEGILVNAVAPGTVDTPMIRAVSAPAGPDGQSSYRPSGNSPLGRVAQADDVANVVSFLLGEQAGYVTGTVIPVDGGTRAAFVPPGVS